MNDVERKAEVVRQYAARFSARDRDGWLSLFVDAPEITEPAHAPPRRGREPLEQAFDRAAAAGLTIELTPRRIIVNGAEAAMHMDVRVTTPDGQARESSVIEIFRFAEDGKLAAMKAFIDLTELPVDPPS